MKSLITAVLLFTSALPALASPHHHRNPTSTEKSENMLEKPLHTTALMAGEAMQLTESAQGASQTQLSTSASSARREQYEL